MGKADRTVEQILNDPKTPTTRSEWIRVSIHSGLAREVRADLATMNVELLKGYYHAAQTAVANAEKALTDERAHRPSYTDRPTTSERNRAGELNEQRARLIIYRKFLAMRQRDLAIPAWMVNAD